MSPDESGCEPRRVGMRAPTSRDVSPEGSGCGHTHGGVGFLVFGVDGAVALWFRVNLWGEGSQISVVSCQISDVRKHRGGQR